MNAKQKLILGLLSLVVLVLLIAVGNRYYSFNDLRTLVDPGFKTFADEVVVDNSAIEEVISWSAFSKLNPNVQLLARAIYSEARGEPYIGQVAVGAVILNRVKSKSFPNTIAGVIYQPWAFSAVHDGQINLKPDWSAVKAAYDALSGWDPTGGALFYWNPAKAISRWVWSRPIITRIGKHVFAR